MKFERTTFGDQLDFEVPDGCDLIVLCINTMHHEPVTVLLPHQVYKDDLEALLKKYPDADSFTILPVRSAEKIEIPLTVLKK